MSVDVEIARGKARGATTQVMDRDPQPAPLLVRSQPRRRPIVVMRGDGAANDLLDASIQVLDATGVPLRYVPFDLRHANRVATEFGVVEDAAKALEQHKLGIKAATMRPYGTKSVDRALRRAIDADVIVRTADQFRRANAAEKRGPITIIRMAYTDNDGQIIKDQTRTEDDYAFEYRKVPRSRATRVARYAFQLANEQGGVVIGGPERPKDTLDGMLWQEINFAQDAYPDAEHIEGMTLPRLVAHLLTPDERHLYIPAYGRDGNILSEYTAKLAGGTAATLPSTTLTLDADYKPVIVLADAFDDEPARRDPDPFYDPSGMILAGSRLLGHMPEPLAVRGSIAIRESVIETWRGQNLSGRRTTKSFTDEVEERVRARMKHQN